MRQDNTEVGRVSSVSIDRVKRKIYVTVSVGPNTTHTKIPFKSGGNGVWHIPESGEIVEVHELNGQYVARWPEPTTEHPMPDSASPGDYIIKLGESTKLHFDKKESGGYNLTIRADTIDIQEN
jgi:hypothetical protein